MLVCCRGSAVVKLVDMNARAHGPGVDHQRVLYEGKIVRGEGSVCKVWSNERSSSAGDVGGLDVETLLSSMFVSGLVGGGCSWSVTCPTLSGVVG